MNVHIPALPLVVAAFLIGSIPFGLVVSRVFFKRDIRAAGSGNIGAANALRTMGRKAGIAVLVLDALKGIASLDLPVALILWEIGTHRAADLRVALAYGDGDSVERVMGACGLAAIVGHCYSPWLRLKGGKGVATFLGVLIAAAWPSALAFSLVWLAIVVPAGLASLGSISGAVAGIVVLALIRGPWTYWFSLPALALIVWKHKENLGRLYTGTESTLNLLKR